MIGGKPHIAFCALHYTVQKVAVDRAKGGPCKEQVCAVNRRDPAACHCRVLLAGCGWAWGKRRADGILSRAAPACSV